MTRKQENVKCPDCGQFRVVKAGMVPSSNGLRQRFQCRNCGKTFYERNLSIGSFFGLDHNDPNVKLRERYLELAAMFKEVRKGSFLTMQKIIEKFKVQMGVKDSTVREYLDTLVGAGLLSLFKGSGRWKYNEGEEWDLFHVPVESDSVNHDRKRR